MNIKIKTPKPNLTKAEIIDHICHTPEWQAICRRIASGNDICNDLYQEFIIVLLEMPDIKITELNNRGELQFYCVRVLLNMFRGENTPFYKNFRNRPAELLTYAREDVDEYNHEIDRQIERMERFLSELPHYEREIFRGYVRHGSLRKFSKEIDIVTPSLAATVSKVRQKFKEQLRIVTKRELG